MARRLKMSSMQPPKTPLSKEPNKRVSMPEKMFNNSVEYLLKKQGLRGSPQISNQIVKKKKVSTRASTKAVVDKIEKPIVEKQDGKTSI